MAAEEYLPPVVTKLKADLSDFMAGILQARAAMKEFAQGTKADMATASKTSGAEIGIVMVRQVRTVIKEESDDVGEDLLGMLNPKGGGPADRAGKAAATSFLAGMRGLLVPGVILIVLAALPGLSAAIAGAIQLGLGLGFIGLGAFMLRSEPQLIAAATRFRDRVASVFRTASAPMLVPFILALDKLGQSFERVGPSIAKGFAALAPAIVPLATGIGLMMEALAPGLTEMVVQAGPIIMAFAETLPGIGKSLGEFFQMIADHAPEIGMFIQDMGRVVPAVIRGFSDVIGTFITVYGWISKIHEIMQDAGWETPLHGLVTIGKTLRDWGSETGPEVRDFFVNLGEDIETWADKAVVKVEGFVSRVGDWFAGLPAKAGAGLAALPGFLGRATQAGFDAMFFYASYGATRLIQSIISLPGQLFAIFTRGWQLVGQLTRQGVEALVVAIEILPGLLGAHFGRIFREGVEFFFRLKMETILLAGQAVIAVSNFFGELPGRIGAHLLAMKNRAVQFFWDASAWLYNAGKDLIRGLSNGILDAVNAAVDAINRAMGRIKEGARRALGLASPSKIFAEYGRMTMLGYAQGIMGEQSGIKALLGSFGAPSLTGARNTGLALSAASGGTGGGGQADNRPLLVQLLAPSGEVLLEVLIPAAQRRKERSGQTGLS